MKLTKNQKNNKSGIAAFFQVLAETDEALIALLIDNDAIKAIPVVSLTIGFLKGTRDIRDLAFAAKLKSFLSEPCLVRSLKTEKMRVRLANDKYGQEVGERLFLTLEKMADMQKPKLLARAFSSYLNGEIDRSAFYLVAQATSTCTISIAIGSSNMPKTMLYNPVPEDAFRRLEPSAGKLACSVLRGRCAGKTAHAYAPASQATLCTCKSLPAICRPSFSQSARVYR